MNLVSGALYKTKKCLTVCRQDAIQEDNSVRVQDIIDVPENEFLFYVKIYKNELIFLYKTIMVMVLFTKDNNVIGRYLEYIYNKRN